MNIDSAILTHVRRSWGPSLEAVPRGEEALDALSHEVEVGVKWNAQRG
jgi:hypothetical protein